MENNNKKIGFVAMATSFVAGAITMLLLSRRRGQNVGQWADEMREEVMREAQKTKDMTEEKYSKIIDRIRPRYEAMKDVGSQELNDLIDELKSHWKNISKEAKNQIEAANQEKKASTSSK